MATCVVFSILRRFNLAKPLDCISTLPDIYTGGGTLNRSTNGAYRARDGEAGIRLVCQLVIDAARAFSEIECARP